MHGLLSKREIVFGTWKCRKWHEREDREQAVRLDIVLWTIAAKAKDMMMAFASCHSDGCAYGRDRGDTTAFLYESLQMR